MGNNIYSGYQDLDYHQYASLAQLKPLKFHDVYSRGIVSPNRLVLRCIEHGSGVAFSDRPIHPGEIICIKVVMFQKGVFRFGVTTCDPGSLNPETFESFMIRNPKSVSLREVSNSTTQKNSLIFFKFTSEGRVVYGWKRKEKEKDKGVLIHEVPTHLPVWAIFDISGRNIALRLEGDTIGIVKAKYIGKQQKVVRSKSLEMLSSAYNAGANPAISDPPVISNVQTTAERRGLNFLRQRSLSISGQSRGTRPQSSTAASETSLGLYSSDSRTKRNRFSRPQLEERVPMCFHCKVGKNISLSSERTTATNRTGMSNGYVFTRRPLWLDEKFVICIMKVNGSSGASLGFGLTVCDPKTVTDFPDEADDLLDREEYWIFVKDACVDLVEGDELAFMVNKKGEVGMSKNKSPFRTLMHVDPLMMFWAFFDVTGRVQKISSLGTVLHRKQPTALDSNDMPPHQETTPESTLPDNSQNALGNLPRDVTNQVRDSSINFDPFSDLPPLPTPPLIPIPSNMPPAIPLRKNKETNESKKTTSSQPQKSQVNAVTKLTGNEIESQHKTHKISQSSKTPEELLAIECSICLENLPDCVLYTCGHMCLCYECGQNILKSKNPLCPLCRKQISDIIKVYKS